MPDIVLATLNARYVHASLGLRYLRANMGELRSRTRIVEFVLGARPLDIVEQLLALAPRIIGFGAYIWNVDETARVVAQLKRVAPEVIVVVGGPEVSHETDQQRVCADADYTVTGWGDVTFPRLARSLLAGERPAGRVVTGEQPPLQDIALPYDEYTDEDIARRFIYVEASRGCPFKCEFCLSALDRTAWPFDLDALLGALARLHDRGARHFRFVDRTFNLKVATSLRILEFFLERMDDHTFLHFELIPDHLPEALKQAIVRFPAGALHFEVGIQTWKSQVQALISRRQDNERAAQNIAWLREHTDALVHVDLIAGLPDEDLASFGAGFDRLLALKPHEIQVGILKRLRGTPIARHTATHAMRYNPDPPYNVLATSCIPFPDMQRITRFARYWDMVGNSGRYARAVALLLNGDGSAFARFMAYADWFYARTGKTHEIALERMYDALHEYLVTVLRIDAATVEGALAADYEGSGAKGRLSFMRSGSRPEPAQDGTAGTTARRRMRQVRHLQTG